MSEVHGPPIHWLIPKSISRPAAPEAPMKISMEGGDVTLFWKPSKSDGGCTIEHYQLEKKDSDKESWAACGHTNGNTYVLPNLAPNTYTFRLIIPFLNLTSCKAKQHV